MAEVTLRNLEKRYQDTVAIRDLSFEVGEGEFFCLLGPPGAGKTTTFRIIAGLEHPDAGEVRIDGESVAAVPPQRRDVAMVFEDAALYPHMTGFGNISHALFLRRMPRDEIEERVEEIAQLLQIEHLLNRHPETYSGGESRRVAVARAMVRRPRVLLLDQALSDLDAKLRQEMAAELKRLQRETGQTMVYATHDFEEGVAMADRCLVIRDGTEIQTADPQTLYARPASAFVGVLVGSPAMNLFRCRTEPDGSETLFVHDDFRIRLEVPLQSQDDVLLGLRPEDLRIVEPTEDGQGLWGEVGVVQNRGLEKIVEVRLGEGTPAKVVVPLETEVERGMTVNLEPRDGVYVFESESGRRLHPSES